MSQLLEYQKRKFFSACTDGDINHVKRMIFADSRASLLSYKHLDMDDIDNKNFGFTPLAVAANNGHIEIVRYLLDKRIDVDGKNDVRMKIKLQRTDDAAAAR